MAPRWPATAGLEWNWINVSTPLLPLGRAPIKHTAQVARSATWLKTAPGPPQPAAPRSGWPAARGRGETAIIQGGRRARAGKARTASESAGTRRPGLAPRLRRAHPPRARLDQRRGHPPARHAGRSLHRPDHGRRRADPARVNGLLRRQQAQGLRFDQLRPVRASARRRPAPRDSRTGLHRRPSRRGEHRVVDLDQRRRPGQPAGPPPLRRGEALSRPGGRPAHPRDGGQADRRSLVVRRQGPRQAGTDRGPPGTGDHARAGPGRRQETRDPPDAVQARPQGHVAQPNRRRARSASKGSPVGECRPLSRHEIELLRKVAAGASVPPPRFFDGGIIEPAARRIAPATQTRATPVRAKPRQLRPHAPRARQTRTVHRGGGHARAERKRSAQRLQAPATFTPGHTRPSVSRAARRQTLTKGRKGPAKLPPKPIEPSEQASRSSATKVPRLRFLRNRSRPRRRIIGLEIDSACTDRTGRGGRAKPQAAAGPQAPASRATLGKDAIRQPRPTP